MAVSYRKLWHILLDKKISKTKFPEMVDISDYTYRKLRNDQDVSTEVLTKICTFLNCDVQDIVEFMPNQPIQNIDLTGKENNHIG